MTADYEARTDRNGNLAPLASEEGFRLQGSLMYATSWLGSQDDFLKLSASGSKFLSIGQNLIVRFDLRYDEGFPLGGASLLPEVERFFAGGDSTVRGYNDDSMATEIVQVKVPPLGNISQIRVIPAGGNIRAAVEHRRPGPDLEGARGRGVHRCRHDLERVEHGDREQHPAVDRHRACAC